MGRRRISGGRGELKIDGKEIGKVREGRGGKEKESIVYNIIYNITPRVNVKPTHRT